MTTENSKIIEINGVKFEVDARTATLRQVSNIKVGAKVKVLKDEKVYYGTVIGFEPFQTSPVVVICYIDAQYYSSAPELKFLYFSDKSKESIVISSEDDDHGIERDEVVRKLEKEIEKNKTAIKDLEDKKQYFLRNFQQYWNAFELPQKVEG